MKLLKLIPTVIFDNCQCFYPASLYGQTNTTSIPGSLAMKISPATEVHIVQTSARQDGENIVVDGQVERKKIGGRGIVKGHIDIEIIDDGGQNSFDKVVTDFSPRIVPESLVE